MVRSDGADVVRPRVGFAAYRSCGTRGSSGAAAFRDGGR